MENLPFIVGTNPFMSRILDVHASSFHRIATYPEVTTLEQNEKFTAELERLVNSHVDDIPQMAKGYCSPLRKVIVDNPQRPTAYRSVLGT